MAISLCQCGNFVKLFTRHENLIVVQDLALKNRH